MLGRCAVLLLPLAACGLAEPAGIVTEAGFAVQAAEGRLVLRNGLPVAVHYVALEEEAATRVDLYFDPTRWPSVAPGAEVRLPYDQVTGYVRGAEWALVHWWTSEGSHATPLRVRLR